MALGVAPGVKVRAEDVEVHLAAAYASINATGHSAASATVHSATVHSAVAAHTGAPSSPASSLNPSRMPPYNVLLWVLIAVLAVTTSGAMCWTLRQQLKTKVGRGSGAKTVIQTASFKRLRIVYLAVFLTGTFADWLQGPYV